MNYTNQLLKKLKNVKYIHLSWTTLQELILLKYIYLALTTKKIHVTDIFRKWAQIILLNDKKGEVIPTVFQSILEDLGHKPNKIQVDKGSEKENETKIYSIHNKGKAVVTEGFTETLKNKIYKINECYIKKFIYW